MKKLIAILAIVITSNTFATERPLNGNSLKLNEIASVSKFETSIYKMKGSMVVKLFINQKATNTLNIKLIDTKGNVLVTEKTKQTGTSGYSFDMTNLAEGDYKIEISNGIETVTKNITVKFQKVTQELIVVNQ